MEDLRKVITETIVKSYSDESLSAFFEKYDFFKIFELIHLEEDSLTEEFILQFSGFLTRVLTHKKYAEIFLFSKEEKQIQLLSYLIKAPKEEFRQFLSIAIAEHVPFVTEVLNQADDKQYELYIGALFTQLNDESSKVGLRMLKIISRIAKENKHQDYSIVKSKTFYKLIENGLRETDSVIQMRYIDLVIDITNQEKKLHELFKDNGLLKNVIDAYKTEDILMKLSIVEALPRMGDSEWNAKYITENLVTKSMLKECFDPDSDFYIRKNVGILVTKLVARGLVVMDKGMQEGFVKLIKGWLSSGYKEELYGVLDLVSVLVLKNLGFEILFKNFDLLGTLFSFALTTDSNIKGKFLHVLAEIFNQEFEKKDEEQLRRCWALVGAIGEVIKKTKVINELDLKNFEKSYEYLIKVLFLPFDDLEFEGALILKRLLQHEWAIMDFAKNESSIKYFFEHTAKTKPLFDLKREILNALIAKIEGMDTKDLFLIDFKTKLITGAKKGMKSTGNEATYATDIL